MTKSLTLRQQKALARQEQILEVAVRLFAQNGFAGTTTKQIAQEIGIAEGLIFHYFPTKRDLLKAVLRSRHNFVVDARSLLDHSDNQPFTVVLQKLSEGWLAFLRRERAFTSMLLSEAHINDEVRKTIQQLVMEGITRLGAFMAARCIAGELWNEVAPETLGHMFLGSLILFFMVHRDDDDQEWNVHSDKFIRELIANWRVFTTK